MASTPISPGVPQGLPPSGPLTLRPRRSIPSFCASVTRPACVPPCCLLRRVDLCCDGRALGPLSCQSTSLLSVPRRLMPCFASLILAGGGSGTGSLDAPPTYAVYHSKSEFLDKAISAGHPFLDNHPLDDKVKENAFNRRPLSRCQGVHPGNSEDNQDEAGACRGRRPFPSHLAASCSKGS